MIFTNYKEVNYNGFIIKLNRAYTLKKKTYMQIAVEIGIKTHVTVMNAFKPAKQMVSDKVLTGIMKAVDMDGFTLHRDGERKYFISNK